MADRGGQLSARAQAKLGLPDNLKYFSPFPFGGMNNQSSPIAMADNEFLWLENFARLGDGNLRTLWDAATAAFTASGALTIVNFSFYTIGSTFYVVIFLSDGSAVQLNTQTLGQTPIGSAGTFYTSSSPANIPFARQWGTQYLLISNRNTTNDYWVWDGSLLYAAGGAAPSGVDITFGGTGYNTSPTITAYGGHGSGMTFTSVVNDGQVVLVNITNPGTGYQVGDQIQLAFSGGGSDTSAILTANLNRSGVGAVNVTAGGSGYTSAPSVSFTGGGGSGAAGTALLGGGLAAVGVTAGGSGYITAPSVSFSGGGGSGATATATVSAGAVVSLTLTNPGVGYSSAPTISFSGGGGTGATATATTTGTAGEVVGVQITTPGSGYTSAPTVGFSGGGGTGAAGAALLNAKGVGSITVVNGGTDYTGAPTITITGGGGAGATGGVYLTATSVASINVTNPGSGYEEPPTVAIISGDGNGSGATAVAHIAGGQLAYIQVTNGGSGYTSQPLISLGQLSEGGTAAAVLAPTSIASAFVLNSGSGYTSAPAVIVSPGSNNSAAATVNLMPFGVSGSAIETFLSRVWVLNPAISSFATTPPGTIGNFSAAGTVWDFATSDGGGAFVSTDAFLQTQFENIRQSSGYLYTFGDGSVNVLSNVQTSGTPATTTFNNQNVDPQAGLEWRDALQDFGRSTIMANATGVFGLYGGAATKISSKLDQLFTNAVFPPVAGALIPTSAIATIFNVKHYLLLMTVLDPDTQALRNVMIAWNEKDWTVASQGPALTQIATQKIRSSYRAWGSDGKNLYAMFSQPSSTLTKRIDTKVYGTDRMFVEKSGYRLWLQAQDESVGQVGVAATASLAISGIGAPALSGRVTPAPFAVVPSDVSSPLLQQPAFQAPEPFWPIWATAIEGNAFMGVSLRLTSTSPDFTLGNLIIGYLEETAFS